MGNTPSQPSKFRTKNWVEINDDSLGTYCNNSGIKFKTTMLKSSLCDYSDSWILVKGTITLVGQAADSAAIQADRNNKQVIFKNFELFTDCVTETNNSKVDNAKDLVVALSMYNLIEYNDNYSGSTGIS